MLLRLLIVNILYCSLFDQPTREYDYVESQIRMVFIVVITIYLLILLILSILYRIAYMINIIRYFPYNSVHKKYYTGFSIH